MFARITLPPAFPWYATRTMLARCLTISVAALLVTGCEDEHRDWAFIQRRRRHIFRHAVPDSGWGHAARLLRRFRLEGDHHEAARDELRAGAQGDHRSTPGPHPRHRADDRLAADIRTYSLVTLPLPALITQMWVPSKATPTGYVPTEKVPTRLPSLGFSLVTSPPP